MTALSQPGEPTDRQQRLPRVARLLRVPKRPYLVCVRLGSGSAFERWFRPDQARSWDLLLSYYQAPDNGPLAAAEYIAIGGLSKFTALKDIDGGDPELFRHYKAIWCVDDDIEIDFFDVDVLFERMTAHSLALAQPALTPNSPKSWEITTQDPGCQIRCTNFVEIMMPAFSQAAFRHCVDGFDRTISGYGLDFYWSKLLRSAGMSLGIVDTVVARHTKPIDNDDGPFYKYLKSIGVHADQELKKMAEDLRLTSDDLPRVVKRVAGGASPVETTAVSSVTKLRTLYLDTMERMLTGTIYRDPSQEPWSPHEYTDAKRESGRDWPALAHTMIGRKRLHNLRELTERVLAENIPGDLIETGVWRGGACILMAAILHAYDCPDRRVFVADSFEGLPKPDAKYPADQGDIHHTYSELAISLEEVQDNFGRYALLDEKIVFLKGWFKDTLPIAPIEKLAILRLDGDMYESTMDALTNLYSKLSKGGYCIVDDGNIANCQAAVADFRRSYGISDPIIDIDGWGFYWKKT